ncbi:MAG: tryptophan-rich sensory protein [Candidatus Diapherotrites archaeon]|nr:tryptophan-rich sensory protein [Candidatus Diapherotrites archaeon]
MAKTDFLKLAVSIVICLCAGFIGSFFTSPNIPTWYASINKPFFNPPNWIFAPVWTILFILMGISLYLVWSKGLQAKGVKIAIAIFAAQLVLNTLWSILFFGLQNPFFAFIEIIVLWIFILLSIIKFYPISRKAALLLLPYICWVSFALLLNYFVWILN